MGQSSSIGREPPPLDFCGDCVVVERYPLGTVENGAGTERSVRAFSAGTSLTTHSCATTCTGGSSSNAGGEGRGRLSLFLSRPIQIDNLRRRWCLRPSAVSSRSLHTGLEDKPISSSASLERSASRSSSPVIAGYASESNEPMDLGKGGNGPHGMSNPLTTARSGMTAPAHETRHGMKRTDETSCDDFVKGSLGGYKSEARGDADVPTSTLRINTMLDDIIEDHAVQIGAAIASQTSPALMGRDMKAVPSPRRAMSLPASTSVCDLDTLQERKIAENKTSEGKTSEDEILMASPDSAIRTPCKDVWLCSKPTRSSTSPPSAEISSLTTPASPRPHLVPGIITPPSQGAAKRNRQFVTRAMSTGRIAREFDEEGRIVCLSSHSERVLWAKQVHLPGAASRSSSPVRPALEKSYSAQTPSSPLSSTGSTISRVVTFDHQQQMMDPKGRSGVRGGGMLHRRNKGYAMMDEVAQTVTVCRGDQRMRRLSCAAESEQTQKYLAGL